jgi:hypothetical protein
MKRFILSALLLAGTGAAFAQNRVGLELGAGMPLIIQNVNSVNTDIVFSANTYYLRKISHHWYLGGRAFFEQYSFQYNSTTSDGAGGVYGTGLVHKSSYLNFGPMIDFGVGRHREYLHFYASASVGFNLNAAQQEHRYYVASQNPGLEYDTHTDTHLSVNTAEFRFGMGIKQHFPIAKMWQITFNEGYSFMPFGELSQPDGVNQKNLHPGYLTFQIGLMHKFRDAGGHSAEK